MSDAERQQALETEAEIFARYLVGRTPPAELIDRYADANRRLFTAPVDPRDAAILRFVRRHPWSASFLDAAAGSLRPAALLRSKILVMAAILEASPTFADEFLPRVVNPVALFVRLAGLGVAAVARLAVGAVLYAHASRART